MRHAIFTTLLCATLALHVGGCGDDDHNHDHGHSDDHAPGAGLPENVVEAACGDVDQRDATVLEAVGNEADALTLPTDGSPLLLRAPEEGPALVAFDVSVDHGNWRVLIGDGATFVALRQGSRVEMVSPSEVNDAKCSERWQKTLRAHIHGTGHFVVELETEPETEFWIAIKLESVGH